MANKKTYTVKYKRKSKTNYKKRLKYLTSKKTRITVRTTTKNVTIQAIHTQNGEDKPKTQVSALNLKKHGWSHPTGNKAAGYLVGLLFAKKAGIETGVVDIGFRSVTKGARIASVIKGLIDGGIELKHNPKILPEESKLKEKYSDFEKTKKNIQGEK